MALGSPRELWWLAGVKFHRGLLLAFFLGLAPWAASAAQSKTPAPPSPPPPPSFAYVSQLGLGLIQGSSLLVGGQLGFPVSDKYPAYAGPEIHFALYSPGALYTILGTFWYEIRVHQAPKSGVSLGASVGVVVPESAPSYPNITYAAFVDGAVSQEVDKDVWVRAQFRPGVVGKYFAFLMNMNVVFLFR